MKAQGFRDTGRFIRRPARPGVYTPSNLAQLVRCLSHDTNIALPLRPMGAATAVTDCNVSTSGTVINMTHLDRITHIDTHAQTVTAEAGVRLGALIAALAEKNLELIGNFDQTERTLGGALAAPCMGPGIGEQASLLSAQVIRMKIVTADGRVMKISDTQKNLLGAFCLSYGMLGVIYEATLRVQSTAIFSASHRCMNIDTFAQVCDRLTQGNVGLKFYLLPYRDQVYLDLRHYENSSGSAYQLPWKFKDWSETTVLPGVFKVLNRVLPMPSARFRLMDSIAAVTHGFLNSRLVRNGNNAAAGGRHRRKKPRGLLYSTWCFPASDFSLVVKAYTSFCRATFDRTAYRCDLPAVGHRIAQDDSALLSPSFDEPLIALQTVTTQRRGWDGFVLDLSEFAENWGGIPLLHQTLAIRGDYVSQTYADRIQTFRNIRRQMDPGKRLLNPFLARYFE